MGFAHLSYCLNRFLNVKVLVGVFNKEKVLVVKRSVIVTLPEGGLQL